MPGQAFLTIFQKKKGFKKSRLNTTEGESDGTRPSFSRKWGTKQLNQKDGEKVLLNWGIYIGTTLCKNIANMKKQQKHIDWDPTDPSSVARGLTRKIKEHKIYFKNFL